MIITTLLLPLGHIPFTLSKPSFVKAGSGFSARPLNFFYRSRRLRVPICADFFATTHKWWLFWGFDPFKGAVRHALTDHHLTQPCNASRFELTHKPCPVTARAAMPSTQGVQHRVPARSGSRSRPPHGALGSPPAVPITRPPPCRAQTYTMVSPSMNEVDFDGAPTRCTY
jgi:hypothetical protein